MGKDCCIDVVLNNMLN